MLNSQIMPGEVDRYRFPARKGQQLVFVTCARALIPYLADAVPGWFQATLTLFDSDGKEVAYSDHQLRSFSGSSRRFRTASRPITF